MTAGAALWEQFVAGAGADADAVAEAADDPARLRALAHRAFRIGLSSLLLGAEDVGRLAIAIERAIDRLGDPAAGAAVPAELAAAIGALHAALHQLAHADRSGARVEGLALDDHRRALDATDGGVASPTAYLPREPLALSASGAPQPTVFSAATPAPAPATAASAAAAPAAGFVWTPTVDDDMIELFFDEANERIAALAGKLIELERSETGVGTPTAPPAGRGAESPVGSSAARRGWGPRRLRRRDGGQSPPWDRAQRYLTVTARTSCWRSPHPAPATRAWPTPRRDRRRPSRRGC
jgi:hypothetical protein